MRINKTIKKEVEEEVIDKMICDNCEKEILYPEACGYGAEYHLHLSDKWCSGCGGRSWDFCSLECLKSFIDKLEAERGTK